MSLTIPTTQEQIDQNQSVIEAQINQNTPTNDKAFTKVISTVEGLQYTTLRKYGAERAKQNLALTATGSDLDLIGDEYEVPRKDAENCVLVISLPAIDGTVVTPVYDFKGISNGIRYINNSNAIAAGGVALITVTSEIIGVVGNLEISDTLSIGSQLAGAETIATVVSVSNVGADAETDDNYRIRILDVERNQGGGGNSADYRRWSQEVSGVARAYPYSGRPLSVPGVTNPPERSVFVEADVSIDSDGIAPSGLIAEVLDSITYDANGKTRQPLGLTNATLWVLSITRKAFDVTVTGLVIDVSVEAQVKAQVATALDTYFRSLRPYIDGLDFIEDKNDTITGPTIIQIIQNIIGSNGGSFTSVTFNVHGSGTITIYTLGQGELSKAGTISWS